MRAATSILFILNGLCNLLPAGKDYTLLHQAPIVAMFVLDHVSLPLPSLFEIDNQIVPRKYTPPFLSVCFYVI